MSNNTPKGPRNDDPPESGEGANGEKGDREDWTIIEVPDIGDPRDWHAMEREPSDDLDLRREDARRKLAVSLITIFGVEIFAALAVLGALIFLCADDQHFAHAKEILTLVLTPTVALVGSATGFYFGAKA
ncbi:MAG: hypothetical protein PVI23_15650 [Maricaulaceae bacterium]|jgi:hypothetical protein